MCWFRQLCPSTSTAAHSHTGLFVDRSHTSSSLGFIKAVKAAGCHKKKAGLRIASAPCCMLPFCARFCARGNRHRLPKQAAHAHAHHHSVAAAHGRVPLSSRFAQHPAGFDVCSIRPFYGNVNTFPAHLCRNDAILTNYTNPPVWQVMDLPNSYKHAILFVIVTQLEKGDPV